MKWDPAKYVQFGDYRDRPYFDLTARVHADSPRHVVDLGCGPGNLTATLAERWPEAKVTGLDSSAEMLAQSAAHAERLPNLSFAPADIAGWMPSGDTDVVVTNAALQWVPGHRDMLARWLAALKPGAWFALQVPGNFNAPSHALMRGLAESAEWQGRLAGVLRHDDVVGEPEDYLNIMLDAGCDADAWETTYSQLLAGPEPRPGVGPRYRTPACSRRVVRRGCPRFRSRILGAAGRGLPGRAARNRVPVPADLRCGPQAGMTSGPGLVTGTAAA